MRLLLPLLLLPLIAVAAPVPEKEKPNAKMKRLFGELADAKKGYEFTLDGEKLVVKMAANASEKVDTPPPRIERAVSGDFEMRAILTLHPPKKKAGNGTPELVAGICITDEGGRHLIRGKHYKPGVKGANGDGWGGGMFLLEARCNAGGRSATLRAHQDEYPTWEGIHLSLQRRDGKYKFGESDDGKEWWVSDDLSYEFSDTVRVGLTTLNTTNAECTAIFSDFTVSPLKPAEKK